MPLIRGLDKEFELIISGWVNSEIHSSTLLKVQSFQYNSGDENWYEIYSKNCYMFVWRSHFHNPLIHTDYNVFVDE